MKTELTTSIAVLLLGCAWNPPALGLDGIEADKRARFQELNAANWNPVFSDSFTGDWRGNWSLDGLKATITNGENGMDFFAGPVPKEDASHAVLWTKRSFKGDLKIEYEYTRTDKSPQFVTILYIQATGSGKDGFSHNIADWADKETVPAMKTYFNHMNPYHISYAAFAPQAVDDGDDYIRARRYLPLKKGLKGTELLPDKFKKTGLFKAGVPHRITVIKKGSALFMMIKNQEKEYLCHWVNTDFPAITEGPVGLRHMYTRGARYKNFRVSTLK